MTGKLPPHRVAQHTSTLVGVEAMTLASAHHFPRHAHDQLGIGLVIDGAQRSWSGIGTVEAGPGELIMVNPGEMHDGAPLGTTRSWRMLYLEPGLVANQLEHAMGAVPPVARDATMAALFATVFGALTGARPDRLAGEEALIRLLTWLARRHAGGTAREGAPPMVIRARQRLDDAPELPVTLAELASLAGVSRFQLLRGFARAFGATPHAYLVQQRVRLARRFLAAGETLAGAATAAGFADQSHMTRAFRRQYGITPGRYRATLA